MAKAKKSAPAVEKKTSPVRKVIAKNKPAQKAVAKKAVKAEKTPIGISGKYTGIKEKKPATTPPAVPQRKISKAAAAKKDATGKGVVKINSLPHGFYEDQLQGYFTQFGDVTNVKVVRSLKTGRSKGVAFVEFAIPEVAEIAAETMNNYLLFKNLLKTEYIPPSQVKPGLFAKKVEVIIKPDGTQVIKSDVITNQKKEVRKLNATPTDVQIKKRKAKFEDKIRRKNKFLASIGAPVPVEVPEKVTNGVPAKKKLVKKQKITVKVSNDDSVELKKETGKPSVASTKKDKSTPAADNKQKSPKKKLEKPTSTTTKAKAGKVKKTPKAAAKEKKRAAWLEENKAKKKAAKKVAVKTVPAAIVEAVKATPAAVKAMPAPIKPKSAPVKVKPTVKATPAPVKPTPAPTEKKVKKAKAAPVAKPVASTPPKKEKRVAAVKAPAAPKAKVEKVKVVKEKAVKAKSSPVKKSIEKKKPLKLNPKKSVK